ncbi:chitin-binding protein [Streptomyces fumigatiscleroticus]|nr:chitin-binding protein [Streptomyces fumigatiscleroticus]
MPFPKLSAVPLRRGAAAVAAVGVAPLLLTALSAAPAAAHGTLGDPVSRVLQCYGENPESPTSNACKAAVGTGGTQALYDWNGIRIGDADGQHRTLIPDGKLCSAGSEEFKGLDLARADWPATSVSSGSYTFKYRVTAQHKGTMTAYITKEGYDPAQPLAWDDLDLDNPVATVTDPAASDGYYTFSGTLPQRTGRQLIYLIWQRSDSPEAFYSCSDVTYGGGTGTSDGSGTGTGTGTGTGSTDVTEGTEGTEGPDGAGTASPAPAASAPTDEQIEAGADRSTVENHGHGDNDPGTTADPAEAHTGNHSAGNRLKADGASENLAETGGDSSTPYLAVGGAAVLALGASVLFASARRRALGGGRHGR